jgi:hypothetical protein
MASTTRPITTTRCLREEEENKSANNDQKKEQLDNKPKSRRVKLYPDHVRPTRDYLNDSKEIQDGVYGSFIIRFRVYKIFEFNLI